MPLFKLTDQNMRTYGGFQWELGQTRRASGEGGLCGPGWLHAYEAQSSIAGPLVALLLNPLHADFHSPKLFVAEGIVGLRDGNLKCGCTSLTLQKALPPPEITSEQKIRFGIYCAWKRFRNNKQWATWARNWLSGKDRSIKAAHAAAYAAHADADAAYAAAYAANAAAAYAAADAARATAAADAAARAAHADAAVSFPIEALACAACRKKL